MVDSTSPERAAMYSSNRLQIGLFGPNCSSGRAVTMVPERWSGSWPDNLKLARMADEAGIDFLLPIARWKGYGGDTDYQGATLETLTWASGLLASTKRITVFGTVHAPLFNPVIAAKECVTADHIGNGRFGLNLVVGWNEGEFEMFGVEQRDHEKRYEYRAGMARRDQADLVAEVGFRLRGPIPQAQGHPRQAEAGRRHASADHERRRLGDRPRLRGAQLRRLLPAGVAHLERRDRRQHQEGARTSRASTAARSAAIRSASSPAARNKKEAEEYYQHVIIENADYSAIDGILAMKDITPETKGKEEFERQRRFYANGMGGLPIIGDPDHVAKTMAELSHAGLTGMGISLVNYLDELPFFCDEVLPRLERMGLREKRRAQPGAVGVTETRR